MRKNSNAELTFYQHRYDLEQQFRKCNLYGGCARARAMYSKYRSQDRLYKKGRRSSPPDEELRPAFVTYGTILRKKRVLTERKKAMLSAGEVVLHDVDFPRTDRGMVKLNDDELGCWNCGEDYSFDTDATDDDTRKRLPVITSCDHTSCHGCILNWQVAPCMLCKKKSAISPSEPKYDRTLISLLGRCVPVHQKHSWARGIVRMNDNELGCWNCGEDYTFDMNATKDDERERLPVISSCDHTCCHGCILQWQAARAENNNGRVAKKVPCMLCKKKSAICPSEPKYDRRLIDLLGRCSRLRIPGCK